MTDSDSTAEAQRRMNEAANRIVRMANDVADAKQVKEFSGDRQKRAFSVLVVEQLKSGQSNAAAEHYARASDSWGATLNDLGEQLKTALRVIEQHSALVTMYEAARSVLSMEKEKMRL